MEVFKVKYGAPIPDGCDPPRLVFAFGWMGEGTFIRCGPNDDIDDAIRAGMLEASDLPQAEIALLGDTGSRRIDTLVHDLVESSADAGDIVQSEEIGTAMLALRSFMFERVYLGPSSTAEHAMIDTTIRRIFEHLVDERGDDVEEATDYLAGMTDRFAIAFAVELD